MSNYTTPISAFHAEFLKKSIKEWTSYKKKARSTLDYWDSIGENPLTPQASARVHNCGSWLHFRNWVDLDESKLLKADFCNKDKICPACAGRRAMKQVKKVFGQLQSNHDLLDGHWTYHVLTVHHSIEEDFMTVFNRLKKGIDGINRAMQNVRAGQDTQNYWAKNIDGIMYSIEETYTKNGWNIHVNMLCHSSKPLQGLIKKPKRETKKKRDTFWHPDAVETWKQLTGSINVSISPVNVKDDEQLLSDLSEIFKYSLKFQNLSPDMMLIAYRNLYKRRLLGTMGTLRGLKTEVDLNAQDEEDQLKENQMITDTHQRCDTNRIRFSGYHRLGKQYRGGYCIFEALPYDEDNPPQKRSYKRIW
jgi:hypothetical protein